MRALYEVILGFGIVLGGGGVHEPFSQGTASSI